MEISYLWTFFVYAYDLAPELSEPGAFSMTAEEIAAIPAIYVDSRNFRPNTSVC